MQVGGERDPPGDLSDEAREMLQLKSEKENIGCNTCSSWSDLERTTCSVLEPASVNEHDKGSSALLDGPQSRFLFAREPNHDLKYSALLQSPKYDLPLIKEASKTPAVEEECVKAEWMDVRIPVVPPFDSEMVKWEYKPFCSYGLTIDCIQVQGNMRSFAEPWLSLPQDMN